MFESFRAHHSFLNLMMQVILFSISSIRSNLKIYLGLGLVFFLLAFTFSIGYLYLQATQITGLRETLNKLDISRNNIQIVNNWVPLKKDEISNSSKQIRDIINKSFDSLIIDRSRRIKTSSYYWGLYGSNQNREQTSSRAYFQELENYVSYVEFLEGRPPIKGARFFSGLEVVEVAIYSDIRDEGSLYDLSVGDVIHATPEDALFGEEYFLVTGIFQEKDFTDNYWLNEIDSILKPSPPQEFNGREMPIIFLLDDDAISFSLSSELPVTLKEIFFINKTKLALEEPLKLLEKFSGIEKEINLYVPRSLVRTGIDSSISSFQKKLTVLSLPSLLIGSITIAILLCCLIMVMGLISKSEFRNIKMMKMRGISQRDIIFIRFYKLFPFALIPSLMGILFSYILVDQLRLFSFISKTFEDFEFLEIFSYKVFLYGIIFLFGFFIFYGGSLIHEIKTIKISSSRDKFSKGNFFKRYFIDILLIIFSILVFFELKSRDFLRIEVNGNFDVDPILFFSPILILVSILLILLRVFPLFIKIIMKLSNKFLGVIFIIVFYRLSRNNSIYAWPMILVALSSGLAIISGTIINTIDKTNFDQIYYENPVDFRVTNSSTKSNFSSNQIDYVKSIEGVEEVSDVLRVTGKVGTTTSGYKFNLLGVQPDFFKDYAWFREDFSNDSIQKMMNKITVHQELDSLFIPRNSSKIGIWAMQSPYVQDHFLWIVIKDFNDRQFTITLGQIPEKWDFLQADIPETATEPLEIISLQTFMQTGANSATPTNLMLDDLTVNNGQDLIILNFENPGLWTGLPTSKGMDTIFYSVQEEEKIGHSGDKIGKISLNIGSDSGIRGIYRTSSDGFIPGIVSKEFYDFLEIQSNILIMEINGSYVPIKIVGTTNFFPTLNPYRDQFLIVDVDTLLNFMKLRGLTYTGPNELLIKINESDHKNISTGIKNYFRTAKVLDSSEKIDAISLDDLTIIVWRTISSFAIFLGIISLIFGYIIFLVDNDTRYKRESKIIYSLGISKFGRIEIFLLENFFPVIFGLFGGVIAGLISSRLIIGSINRSFFGDELLPPYLLEIDLLPMMFILFVLILVISIGPFFNLRKVN